MARAALDHGVARPELVLAVVETEHDLPVEHHDEVDGVGGVHAGLTGIVARHPEPPFVAGRARRRWCEADGPACDATRGRLELEVAHGIAAVAGVPGRRVEPEDLAHAVVPLGAQRARRRPVGQNHVAAGGVLATHHSPYVERHDCTSISIRHSIGEPHTLLVSNRAWAYTRSRTPRRCRRDRRAVINGRNRAGS